MKKLAIVISHPIQYYAPVFKKLSEQKNIQIKVFYTWGEGSTSKYDPGFDREIKWDIPLLEGYDYQLLVNISKKPGTSHFNGIVNPEGVKSIQAFSPDAVLVYGWAWHSHLRVIRKLSKRVPVWFRGDSTMLDAQQGWRAVARKAFLRWVYRHVHTVFYVGSANKQYFKQFGLQQHQLRFAPHAIDNSRFAACRAAEAVELRNSLNIPASATVVLFAGKLEPKKDPILLLEAFTAVANNNDVLLIAGNGELEKNIKDKAAFSKCSTRIKFIDFQNQRQMPVLYQACQLFCLPSKGPGETWGLAVNEAMAAGKAVLVSDKVGCATDLVEEGKNGTIFHAGNLEDLKKKLAAMLSDSEQLALMGKHSMQIIKDWSFENQVTAITKALYAL